MDNDKQEQWTQIPGFPDYLVSDQGRVMSFRRKATRILKPGGSTYPVVTLCRDDGKKAFLVHHLVLLAFEGPRPKGMEVRHLNGKETDNRLVNLAYGTKKQNELDKRIHGRSGKKLTWSDAREMRALWKEKSGLLQRDLAEVFGVTGQVPGSGVALRSPR
ncbi:NUMOD4 motif-containing HNH endonuclease [Nocardioides nematodiphilus]|uniref:NUMOD4 motif-containing HNH endonuclease n=1 Tax=Nocardioides nematodiphilus TaxID=2849669 RepID=UPI001CDA4028|nr:NUMOD4 motif-containing HNH endonuclease [Nocardioides nematodiphilus]MCA1984209.1 NUMOD4 motif-containing HNH endonuclease [Nocardioides nematodiphilus]